MKYYYFISFVAEAGTEKGFGNVAFERDSIIKTTDDLREVENLILEIAKLKGFNDVTILSIQLLHKE